jgi:hypothetical protein
MHTHERTTALRAELRELQSKSSYTVDDVARVDEIADTIARAVADKSRRLAVAGLGEPPDLPGAGGFADAIRSAGFTGPRGTNVVEVEFKTASFDGDPLDLAPRRFGGAPLAYDTRWLHPVLPQVDVASGDTSVQTFRQKTRTLADPSLMVRAIDATSTKPETDTTTEVVTAALKQVANVSTGTPNVLLESQAFRDFVETDLRLAFGDALDAHVVAQLAAVNPPDAGSAANLLEGARRAITLIQAAGYSPTVIAASPEDLEALDLLTSSGPEATYQFALTAMGPNAANLWGLRWVAVKDLWAPLVLDPQAAGVLYRSPIRFGAFEENAGQTNTSTVRLEAHALFVVQRPDAIAEIPVFS